MISYAMCIVLMSMQCTIALSIAFFLVAFIFHGEEGTGTRPQFTFTCLLDSDVNVCTNANYIHVHGLASVCT